MGNRTFWDDRYDVEKYVYGKAANEFLAGVADRLSVRSRILSLGEGEGRNAVYLASLGHELTIVDSSSVGLRKAERLAREKGVVLAVHHVDIAQYDLGDSKWDAIISFFLHLPQTLRVDLHQRVVKALRPSGLFVMEAYSPEQMNFQSGGPRDPELLMPLEAVKQELAGLNLSTARELIRPISEGSAHTGEAAVIQIIGEKAQATSRSSDPSI